MDNHLSFVVHQVDTESGMSSLSKNWAYRSRVTITVVCVIAGLALFQFSPAGIGEGTALDIGFDAAGWILLSAGIIIRLLATRSIAGRKSQTVVSDGLYSLCRNPLYWGTFLLFLAAVCFLKSWPFAAACLPAVILYPFAVVPAEEAHLRAKLGTEFVEYCEKVPRWWPRLREYRPLSRDVASVPAMRSELLRTVWWLMIPLLLEWLCRVRGQSPFPVAWPFS